MADDDLRAELGKLVRQLAGESDADGATSIRRALREHLGERSTDLSIVGQEMHDWELPNLQLALDSLLARPGWSSRVIGLSGQARHYQGLSLGDLVSGSGWVPEVGPPEYV